ncbi:alpha/beta hydrolase [Pelagibacteraceae bacterium]|nr:alpha/beta hydrolase [Pelagibacteraceae bacterium]|tara:strand:- start:249 stop:1004 length:756 start_codon:yes stop_codon:yes gene_type:complete
MQNIFINEKGDGFPLVLIHGFLGSSKMWKPQINFFKDYFHVISLDLPGFGMSNKAITHNSIESFAETVFECLKEKKIYKFHLMGHSMGGMIAQEMALNRSNLIDKLICHSTGPLGEMPGRFETIEESRKNLKKNGLEKTIKNIAKTWFVLEDKAEYFDLCVESGRLSTAEAADSSLLAMKKWNSSDDLSLIKNKTLIVWGDKDKSYSLNQVKILKQKIPNSTLTIFEGCAHNIHLEQVKNFNTKILNFLKS